MPFYILGTIFHLGILIEFPIPWFALTVVAVYILLLPVGYFTKIRSFFKCKKSRYKFYYDAECPLCVKTVVMIKHFDVFGIVECLTVQGNYQNEKHFSNIDEMTLLINIHGVNKKGKIFVGYDAYTELFKKLIYTYPLGFILGLPGISNLGKKVYSYVAGNRLTERCTTETCPMPVLQKPVLETQDFLVSGFNRLNVTKKFWIFMLIITVFAQGLISWFSPLSQKALERIGLRNTRINAWVKVPYDYVKTPLLKYTGITHHPVFMDGHFKGYNYIVKTTYRTNDGKEILVPLLNDDGMVEKYPHGALWVNYTFRVSSPYLSKSRFEKGVSKYLDYFSMTQSRKLPDGNFVFYVKEISVPTDWEKDFLNNQKSKPWIYAGEMINGHIEWSDEVSFIED